MKRMLFTTVILLLSISIYAQRGLKKEINTANYPEISFVWNLYNPDEIKDMSKFSILEDGGKRNLRVKHVPKANIEKRNKSILFLMEDMFGHGSEKYDFCSKTLYNVFDKIPQNKNDRFNIAVFNRLQNNDNENFLKPISSGFTGNTSDLRNALTTYNRSRTTFSKHPLSSDLYLAIEKGLDLLKKEPSENIRFIVVITSGLNMPTSGALKNIVSDKQTEIPVYIVKYNKDHGDVPDVESIPAATFGKSIPTSDYGEAVEWLANVYKDIDARHYGHDYEITFTTNQKKDGKSHNITFGIDGEIPSTVLTFTSPSLSIIEWAGENIFITALIGLALILLTVSIIWFIRKNIAERNRKIAENETRQQNEISAFNQSIKEMKEQQELKERQQQAEVARKAREEEEKRLVRLMQTKNLFPRLQCRAGNDSFTFNINKPYTSIGRKGHNNDVELDSGKVSRRHAEIVFTGGGFEIIDKGSTNKVIVNGQFAQRATLKNGDIIGLGEAVITFYV